MSCLLLLLASLSILFAIPVLINSHLHVPDLSGEAEEVSVTRNNATNDDNATIQIDNFVDGLVFCVEDWNYADKDVVFIWVGYELGRAVLSEAAESNWNIIF